MSPEREETLPAAVLRGFREALELPIGEIVDGEPEGDFRRVSTGALPDGTIRVAIYRSDADALAAGELQRREHATRKASGLIVSKCLLIIIELLRGGEQEVRRYLEPIAGVIGDSAMHSAFNLAARRN